MPINAHPLVLAITTDHPVEFGPETDTAAWLSGSGACIPVWTAGQHWARCDYAWTWWLEGDAEPAPRWRDRCGALAGPMPDGTWRCTVHEIYWYAEHDGAGSAPDEDAGEE
jgi:hypothetical protein